MTIPQIQSHRPPTPAQWPISRTRFHLDPTRASLLVHDLQEYFLDYFERDQEPARGLLQNTSMLLEACRRAAIPVVYSRQPTEQTSEARGLLNTMWGKGLDSAPHRSGIEPAVAPRGEDRLLTKWRYSAFQRTPLLSDLQVAGRKQLIICGVYAHIGCLATAMEAFMNDIEVFFVGDAMADFSEEKHRMALNCVANCCGTVITTEEMLRVLLCR